MEQSIWRILAVASMALSLITASAPARAATWNSGNDYSVAANPNGAWSYGKKFTVTANAFTLATVRWGDTGWYFGNVNPGSPSFYEGPHLWARSNTEGLPTLRWTSPKTGYYRLSVTFTGDDARGVDNHVYVVLGDTQLFTDRIGTLESTSYDAAALFVESGKTLDFLVQWAGGVDPGFGWTLADVVIQDVDANNSFVIEMPSVVVSGINGIGGWKCTQSGDMTVTVDDGPPLPLATHLRRNDTANACNNDGRNGFLAVVNYSLYGQGNHTAKFFDDGVQFASQNFSVGTLDAAHVPFAPNLNGEFELVGFPTSGKTTTIRWNTANQGFAIVETK